MLTSILDSQPDLNRSTKIFISIAHSSMLHGNPGPTGTDGAFLYRHNPCPVVTLLYALNQHTSRRSNFLLSGVDRSNRCPSPRLLSQVVSGVR